LASTSVRDASIASTSARDGVEVDAAIGERASERRLRGRSAHVARIEAQKVGGEGQAFVEREEAL
jgi:hypothetical protein